MVPSAIGHDTESRPQADMCPSDSWRIMVHTRLWNINPRHEYDKITLGVRLHLFIKIAFQKKESIWRKCRDETMDFTCFSKGFHSNIFRDIIIKSFNWIIKKWKAQSYTCSWAIQHKSPLNIQYNNFKHTTTKCIIFTTSLDHIN